MEDCPLFSPPEIYEAPHQAYFHPAATLPVLLQKRIDGWKVRRLRQSSIYGPNAGILKTRRCARTSSFFHGRLPVASHNVFSIAYVEG